MLIGFVWFGLLIEHKLPFRIFKMRQLEMLLLD